MPRDPYPKLLRSIRKALGWSLSDVQEHIGINRQLWSDWERGLHEPSTSTKALARCLEWAAENGRLEDVMEHLERHRDTLTRQR